MSRDFEPAPRDSDLLVETRRRAESGSDAWRRMGPRLVLGVGLIAAGILFTLDNMGILYADDYLELWPLLLVAFGVSQLASATQPSEKIGGGLWVLVGGWLLASNLGWIRYSIFDLWPLVLVLIGGWLVLRSMRPAGAKPGDDSDTAHGVAVMSGIVRRITSPAFQGGSFTAIMGGYEVDLRGAGLAPGGATIDVLAIMGGIEITVPPDWHVVSKAWPLMGGIEDKRPPVAEGEASGILVLTGFAIMGGVEIKS